MRNFLVLISFIIIASGDVLAGSGPGDSVTARATTKYRTANPLKLVFIGRNYRTDWSMPVRMKVFDPATAQGGLRITELGGGMQTKSLRLKDSQGAEWALRTVDKTVDLAMEAEGIKNPLAKAVAQDVISAAHPYAALTIPPMAKALGLIVPKPQLVFVPDMAAMGEHRAAFANTVCMLEEREPAPGNGDTINTKEMRKAIATPGNRLDTKMMLQARLLDMLIADWDRHEDQWRWATTEASYGTRYFPIPRDRDQAFFQSTGILVPIARMFTMKHLVGFRKDGKKIKNLSRKEWGMDYHLLRELTAQDWQNGIDEFQARLTDGVLQEAVRQLPQEIYALRGETFYEKLRIRRDAMDKEVMKYYNFLKDLKPEDIPKTRAEKEDEKEEAEKEKKGKEAAAKK